MLRAGKKFAEGLIYWEFCKVHASRSPQKNAFKITSFPLIIYSVCQAGSSWIVTTLPASPSRLEATTKVFIPTDN